jgi:hypothetical protein
MIFQSIQIIELTILFFFEFNETSIYKLRLLEILNTAKSHYHEEKSIKQLFIWH